MLSRRFVKRWIMLSTSRRFPYINSSRAAVSPAFVRRSSSVFSSSVRVFSFAVLTPQISTLL